VAGLLEDCADAAVDALMPAPAWTSVDFAALRDQVARALVPTTSDIVARVEKVLAVAHEVQLLLPARPSAAQVAAIDDIRSQLDRLLPQGFVTSTGRARLDDLVRYLTAIARRLDRLPHGIEVDRQRMAQVHAVEDAFTEVVRALPAARRNAADVRDISWQIEELRVSLWAQQLGTPRPVSEQRIHRAIDAVAGAG
jgi:ATP-dependent helicase HrpA